MEALAHDWKHAGLETHYGLVAGGKLLGKQMQPRDVAAGLHAAGLHAVLALSTGVKVCLSESQGYIRAFNDNINAGAVTSRDVGLMQINIPADQIGTPVEEGLYDPASNFAHALRLWTARGFQPWVGYTSNVCFRDTYVKRANRGLANWLADLDLQHTPTDLLAGHPYEHVLTTPMFDYEYRLQAAVNALTAIKHVAARASLNSSIAEIKQRVATGLAAVKL